MYRAQGSVSSAQSFGQQYFGIDFGVLDGIDNVVQPVQVITDHIIRGMVQEGSLYVCPGKILNERPDFRPPG
jgi:hypothetical protein